jgi:hypothetical protein
VIGAERGPLGPAPKRSGTGRRYQLRWLLGHMDSDQRQTYRAVSAIPGIPRRQLVAFAKFVLGVPLTSGDSRELARLMNRARTDTGGEA